MICSPPRPTALQTRLRALALLLSGAATVLLTGCGGDQGAIPVGGGSPFVFRALDLRQQDLLGRPSWTLTSPETRYDINSRIVRAQKPSGTIFRDGKPAYRLTSSIGTVLNDGMVVLLEGDIRLEQLGPQPLMIRASRARWLPRRQLLELDRHAEALDGNNRITAGRARYLFDREELDLRVSPRIEHWSRRFDPFRPQDRGSPEVLLTVNTAQWRPQDGRLEARGPLQGKGQLSKPSGGAAPTTQTLRAASLKGNTRQQQFTLYGPVQLRDPSQALLLLAKQLEIDGVSSTIRTSLPQPGQPAVSLQPPPGTSAVAAEAINPATGCLLLQRQDSLQADECRWNWRDQSLQAQGNVVLKRVEHQQDSRGSLLVGSLGDQGRFRLSAPGGRVVSRFQAPASPPSPPPPPRPAPAPIRL